MLPFQARRSTEQVDRARLGDERVSFPTRIDLTAETEAAGGEQGDANDIAKDIPVTVPADGRAGAILNDLGERQIV